MVFLQIPVRFASKHAPPRARTGFHPSLEQRLAIRDWSFTKLWAVTAATWFVAWGGAEALDYFDIGGLATFALAMVPAFLAGAWAASHPAIAQWPRARLVAMWALALATYFGATDYVGHWRAVALVIAAPVAILSLRWYELTGGGPPRARLETMESITLPGSIVTPPPSPPPKRLPAE